jgi:hypothetical protein
LQTLRVGAFVYTHPHAFFTGLRAFPITRRIEVDGEALHRFLYPNVGRELWPLLVIAIPCDPPLQLISRFVLTRLEVFRDDLARIRPTRRTFERRDTFAGRVVHELWLECPGLRARLGGVAQPLRRLAVKLHRA